MLARQPGRYHSANMLTQQFAAVRRTCFSVMFHTAWIGGPGSDFQLPEQPDEDAEEWQDGRDESDDEGAAAGRQELEDAEDEEEASAEPGASTPSQATQPGGMGPAIELVGEYRDADGGPRVDVSDLFELVLQEEESDSM